MAVYEQTYRRYTGALTPRWSRFLVLSRYAWSEVFSSRFFIAVFAVSFVPVLVVASMLYLRSNLEVLEGLGAFGFVNNIQIDGRLFLYFLRIQGGFAFFLTLLAAPGLVSPDLAHNALPLYLARPFKRWEYVLGKMTVLLVLTSAITWLPGLLLFFFQVQLAGGEWLSEHARIAPAIFFGGWVWILVLALLGLALSAWVRWRTVAAGLLFAVFIVSRALGVILNLSLDTKWGSLVDLRTLITVIWQGLFYGEVGPETIPVWSAWLSLAALCAFCLLLLRIKIRAYEVVR